MTNSTSNPCQNVFVPSHVSTFPTTIIIMCLLLPLCKCSTLRVCLLWACWNIIFGLLLIDQVLGLVRAQQLAATIKIIGCLSGAGFTLSGLMLLAGILIASPQTSRCLLCSSIVVCGLSTLVIHWLILPLGKYF
ncbi:uncharacterized protein LOC117579700 [Drosophila guanche]|uniref:uncharacterized protein LOC117579700 n=1 Tax=Drosophila guanche TaxID=7266 RepID=UPI001471CF6F|nr:uncharacterized protein LOC117579700 [Drosophila guanche]